MSGPVGPAVFPRATVPRGRLGHRLAAGARASSVRSSDRLRYTPEQIAEFQAMRAPIRQPWLDGREIVVLTVVGAIVVVGMWIRHGGPDGLTSPAGAFTGAGQLSALLGTYAALVQLGLMARIPELDRTFGHDRLAFVHRWLGFACLWLLVGHGIGTVTGYGLSDRRDFPAEFFHLVATYPFVLWAVASFGLLVGVAITSTRMARRRLSYDTWRGLHLYAYLAIALGAAHQFAVGADLYEDPVAIGFWICLYVVAFAPLIWFRIVAPIRLSLRHRLRVSNVVSEAPGVTSIHLWGRNLEDLVAHPGQYFRWHFLTAHDWWRSRPFSLSADPAGSTLRITVKQVGEWTTRLADIRPGIRVFFSGPYGRLTAERRRGPRALLIAGGIGITPIRALFETMAGDVVLIYRATRPEDIVFREELDRVAASHRATVHYIVGERGRGLETDPLDSGPISELVPDVMERDVYLCGPLRMMDKVRQSLRVLGVPDRQIQAERFEHLGR